MIRKFSAVLLVLFASGMFNFLHAAETKPVDKDPLAKFSDENLANIGFCFDKFCAAVAAKDATTAAAFIAELPRELSKLDLSKDADKDRFLKTYASFSGAHAISSQRMAIGGLGEVKYTDKSGKENSQRMQNMRGCWKLTF